MPANNTITSGDYSAMYAKQVQKYMDKCTNVNKIVQIMAGDHSFALKIPSQVAALVQAFFSPLF